MTSFQPKQISRKDDARQAIMRGVEQLADVVGATMGPAGRNVILDRGPFQSPISTRDGVTVAKYVALKDSLENLGCQIVRQAASKTADQAGDGTTTATVLAQAMMREGVRMIAAGANPARLKRGIEEAVNVICGEKNDEGNYAGGILDTLATPVTDEKTIVQVGTLSANSDPAIGQMIAEAVSRVGKDGTVTVEESQTTETVLDIVEGMQFDQGYISPYFVTDGERMDATLTGDDASPVYVYLHEKRMTYLEDILPVFQLVSTTGGSLLVIAEDIADQALAFMVVNKMQMKMRCIAVKGPGFGDRRKALFDDLAILTGATVNSPELGIKATSVKLEMLGKCRRVSSTRDDTTIIGAIGDKAVLEARIGDLRAQIERSTSDFDRTRLQDRLARLAGGVAVVRVGGQTEAEMKERRDRAEDAMYAARAAVAEGIVSGGGTALISCSSSPLFAEELEKRSGDERAGFALVARACEEPLRRIASNSGEEGGQIVAELRRRWASGENVGWNAATGQFCDLIEAGVVDPVKVTRTALRSAGSVSALLLTTDALVADDVVAAGEIRKSLMTVMPGGQQMPLSY